jgi:antimicrobial peptide system SdpA family protein
MGNHIVLRAAKAAVVTAWALLLLFVALGSLGDSPLRLGKRERMRLLSVLPEGWAFFTRNPREPMPTIYVRRDGRWVMSDSRAPLTTWFGVKRSARGEGVELGRLLESIPKSAHVRCEGELNACLAAHDVPAVAVVNRARVRSIAGEIIVAQAEPIPWAWSESRAQIQMPTDVVKLDVKWK